MAATSADRTRLAAASALTLPALLLIAASPVLAAAAADDGAAARLPVASGFGVTFGEPPALKLLGASLGALALAEVTPEAATLPANFTEREVIVAAGSPPPWRLLVKPTVPKLLKDRPGYFAVMVDDDGKPLRVIAQVSAADCEADVKWLRNALDKRYNASGDAGVPPRPGYHSALRYVGSQRQIDINCGKHLLIEYADRRAVAGYRRAQRAAARRQEVDRRTIERHTRVRFADMFTLGGRHRLQGGFGIEFNMPFTQADAPSDELFEIQPLQLPPLFAAGHFQLEVNRAARPVRIRATFDELPFERFAQALEAKFGAPMKRGRRHIVHKINGNYASIRQVRGSVQITLIDSSAQKRQRKRQFAEDTEGL